MFGLITHSLPYLQSCYGALLIIACFKRAHTPHSHLKVLSVTNFEYCGTSFSFVYKVISHPEHVIMPHPQLPRAILAWVFVLIFFLFLVLKINSCLLWHITWIASIAHFRRAHIVHALLMTLFATTSEYFSSSFSLMNKVMAGQFLIIRTRKCPILNYLRWFWLSLSAISFWVLKCPHPLSFFLFLLFSLFLSSWGVITVIAVAHNLFTSLLLFLAMFTSYNTLQCSLSVGFISG